MHHEPHKRYCSKGTARTRGPGSHCFPPDRLYTVGFWVSTSREVGGSPGIETSIPEEYTIIQ